jgi:hypothetical protein
MVFVMHGERASLSQVHPGLIALALLLLPR